MREFAAVQLCFGTLTKSDFIPNLIYSKVLEELISETNGVAMAMCQPIKYVLFDIAKRTGLLASTLYEAALALQS